MESSLDKQCRNIFSDMLRFGKRIIGMDEWLTEEEQYKKILNNEEIRKIKDPELREIRMRHWSYRHKIFMDEMHISDKEFCRLSDEDVKREKEELERYRKEHK